MLACSRTGSPKIERECRDRWKAFHSEPISIFQRGDRRLPPFFRSQARRLTTEAEWEDGIARSDAHVHQDWGIVPTGLSWPEFTADDVLDALDRCNEKIDRRALGPAIQGCGIVWTPGENRRPGYLRTTSK